jgi:hypothetical protein
MPQLARGIRVLALILPSLLSACSTNSGKPPATAPPTPTATAPGRPGPGTSPFPEIPATAAT